MGVSEGWGGAGGGGEGREQAVFLSASLTLTIHMFDLKKDLISERTPSQRAVRKRPALCAPFGNESLAAKNVG